MSFGKSANDFLSAREARQEMLSRVLLRAQRPAIFLSLNIPGPEKFPPGCNGLFEWICSELAGTFSEFRTMEEGRDALGPFLLASLDQDATELKQRCVLIESATPAGRLIDLDVYSAQGLQIDRRTLGLRGRACLVCDQPAVECMRNKRHPSSEVIGKVNELLAPFIA